mmetsp:Transcript_7437/g.16948  ORF Transcript_7437/g.16948 Transcript_7437/m.16948 type:complete len:357 (-) Transcript_7437:16-1086(-)
MAGPSIDELPLGWERRTSKTTGKTYFYNKASGQSTWERPGQKPLMLEKITRRSSVSVTNSGGLRSPSLLGSRSLSSGKSEDFIHLGTSDSSSIKIETEVHNAHGLNSRPESSGQADRADHNGRPLSTSSSRRLIRSRSESIIASLEDMQLSAEEEASGDGSSRTASDSAEKPQNSRVQRLMKQAFKSLPSSSTPSINPSSPVTPLESAPGSPVALEREASSGEEGLPRWTSATVRAEAIKGARKASVSSSSSAALGDSTTLLSETKMEEKSRRSSVRSKRELKANDDCFYVDRDGGIVPAKVVRVDNSIDPPGFEVFMISRNRFVVTERFRLLKVEEATVYMERRRQPGQTKNEEP